jgi:hypothetical protein
MADRITNLSIAFGSFANASFTDVPASLFGGNLFQIHSRLDKDVWIQVVIKEVLEDIFVPAFASKWIPLPTNGSIKAKHDGVAPTSGKLVLEAYATEI